MATVTPNDDTPDAVYPASTRELDQRLRMIAAAPDRYHVAICNADLSADDMAYALIEASGVPALTGQVLGDRVFYATYFIVQTGELKDDKTGEMNYFPRTTLFAADGTTLGLTGTPIISTLRTLAGIYPNAPWEPALPLHIRRVDLGGNRLAWKVSLDRGAK